MPAYPATAPLALDLPRFPAHAGIDPIPPPYTRNCTRFPAHAGIDR